MTNEMFNANFNLDAYCERIGYTGDNLPTLANLQKIQLAHATSIPFENISSYLGERVFLDSASLQDKLIFRKRGGYCYEQNLLLWQALECFGFRVGGLAARPRWNASKKTITQRSHMMLHAEIEKNGYMVDVGFGGTSPTALLRLDTEKAQSTPHEPFRIAHKQSIYTLQIQLSGEWRDVYEFDLQPYFSSDYKMFNWYVSTYPKSRFVTNLMIAKPDQNVRYSLINRQFSSYHIGGKTERRYINNFDELHEILTSVFGIHLDKTESLMSRWEKSEEFA